MMTAPTMPLPASPAGISKAPLCMFGSNFSPSGENLAMSTLRSPCRGEVSLQAANPASDRVTSLTAGEPQASHARYRLVDRCPRAGLPGSREHAPPPHSKHAPPKKLGLVKHASATAHSHPAPPPPAPRPAPPPPPPAPRPAPPKPGERCLKRLLTPKRLPARQVMQNPPAREAHAKLTPTSIRFPSSSSSSRRF